MFNMMGVARTPARTHTHAHARARIQKRIDIKKYFNTFNTKFRIIINKQNNWFFLLLFKLIFVVLKSC